MGADAFRAVIDDLHEKLRAACWDSLAGELLRLHRPHQRRFGPSICLGCTQHCGQGRAAYPCDTYKAIAATVLSLPSSGDFTLLLTERLTELAAATSRS